MGGLVDREEFETAARDDHGLCYHRVAKRMVMLEGIAGARGVLVREKDGWRAVEAEMIAPVHGTPFRGHVTSAVQAAYGRYSGVIVSYGARSERWILTAPAHSPRAPHSASFSPRCGMSRRSASSRPR